MKASILDGNVTIEGLRVEEVKLLHRALEKWTLDATHRASELEVEAGERMEAVRGRRYGKTQAARVAGELRNEASGLRAFARDGADLLRVLAWAACYREAR